jgi:hypothetical protein
MMEWCMMTAQFIWKVELTQTKSISKWSTVWSLDTLISQQPSIFPPTNLKKRIYFPIFWIYMHVSNEKIFEQTLSTVWLRVKNNKSEISHNTINGQKRLVFENRTTVKWCKISMTDLHARRSGTCKIAVRSVSDQTRVPRLPFVRNHIAKTVRIPLKVAWTRPRLSFHSCNYGIFSKWCPYVVWATCIHNSVSWRRCCSRLDALASGWQARTAVQLQLQQLLQLLHTSIKSLSQYSTCAYSIIIRLKLTAAAHRVLRTANNDLKRRAK